MEAKIEASLILDAWGERKSLQEWAHDDRATADAKIIRKRFESGMPAELAIGVREGADRILPKAALIHDSRIPFRHRQKSRNTRFIEAFGVAKSLIDWADDYRCAVSYGVLCSRIANGKDPEWAIVTPPLKLHQRPNAKLDRLVAAFGEVKTAREWERDPRSQVGYQGIMRRIKLGMTPEDAIVTPPRGFSPLRRDASGGYLAAPRYLAFGEYKSIHEWRRDHRCKVSLETLNRRMRLGWDMQEAMTRPVGSHWTRYDTHGKMMSAFGETHSLRVWSEHPRCRCTYAALVSRVAAGVDLETALTAPPRAIDLSSGEMLDLRVYRAFGEEKTATQWSQDPRCRCSARNLIARLAAGWNLEDAITTPLMSRAERARLPKAALSKLVTAWGESKRATEWAQDSRAKVDSFTICNRLRVGWAPEDAIALGKRERIVMLVEDKKSKRITAWGETKTVKEWLEDPRVTQTREKILARLRQGIASETAMTATRKELNSTRRRLWLSKTVTAWGETKTMIEWESDPRCKVSRVVACARMSRGFCAEDALGKPSTCGVDRHYRRGKRITAWGETKFSTDWIRDPRCVVSKSLLNTRLANGWTPEQAISSPVVPYQKLRAAEKPNSRMVTAWGETKSAKRWAEDPRAGASASTISKRVAAGMNPEDAVAKTVAELKAGSLPTQNSIDITAWGETKTAVEWEFDGRCAVPRDLFMTRLRTGWTPERAIGQPVLKHEDRVHSNGPDLAGFGEVKCLRAWIRDPRCVVTRKLARNRIENGWSLESAITTPQLPRGTKVTAEQKTRAA